MRTLLMLPLLLVLAFAVDADARTRGAQKCGQSSAQDRRYRAGRRGRGTRTGTRGSGRHRQQRALHRRPCRVRHLHRCGGGVLDCERRHPVHGQRRRCPRTQRRRRLEHGPQPPRRQRFVADRRCGDVRRGGPRVRRGAGFQHDVDPVRVRVGGVSRVRRQRLQRRTRHLRQRRQLRQLQRPSGRDQLDQREREPGLVHPELHRRPQHRIRRLHRSAGLRCGGDAGRAESREDRDRRYRPTASTTPRYSSRQAACARPAPVR